MKTTHKTIALVLTAFLIVAQVFLVAAQANPPTADPSRPQQVGVLYRLASCDPKNPKYPCYFEKVAITNTVAPLTSASATSSGTISCGIHIYDYLREWIGTLQQNVNSTFYGTWGRTPLTMNWGNLGGTGASAFGSWTGLSGPTPKPGWGIRTSGTAYSTASGWFHHLAYQGGPWIGSAYFVSTLTMNSSGYSCH